MDDSPRLSHILTPTLIGCFIGLIMGSIMAWEAKNYKGLIVVGCIFGVGLMGFWMGTWFIGRLEQFRYYEFNFSASSMPDRGDTGETGSAPIISITIPELNTTRQIRGLLVDEWHTLAHGVVERGYRYTTRDLQDIFGAQEGNRVYGRVTQQLVDAGVLIPSGAKGLAVTDHVGRHFFIQLDKRDYKVIDLIPFPGVESA